VKTFQELREGKVTAALESVEESVQLGLTEATVSRSDFEKLKKGMRIEIDFGSSISSSQKRVFTVKSTSRSAKYNVDKINMTIDGKGKYHLYSRNGKDATLALGNMAASIKSYKILGTNESVELDEAVNMGPWNRGAINKAMAKAGIKGPQGKAFIAALRVSGTVKEDVEDVELDEAADFEKISNELLKHKKKGIEFEKAAAFARVMFMNSSLSVQDKAFMGLTKLLKDMDDLVKKTTITKILKDNGFRVKGGKLMREGLEDSVESLDENYRTLATKGMGAETKNSINVGRGVDFYEPKNGDKRMGKITKMTKSGYVVKDEKDGKSYTFSFHDSSKAKELLAKHGKGKYNESVKTEDKGQFIYAAKQAKAKGDSTFVFAGKTYNCEEVLENETV
jgi:hypothetical protein